MGVRGDLGLVCVRMLESCDNKDFKIKRLLVDL